MPKTTSQGPRCTELAGVLGAPEGVLGACGKTVEAGGPDMAGPYSPLPSSVDLCCCESGCCCPGVCNNGGNSEAGPKAGTAGI
ncbi:hypothetical protein, partial [Paraburkholderia sp.]|uniref:hypothetical protein n=1 Tax=Paraburkholderia sp. TaxID=1926495 RepID=UPI003C7D458B